MWGGLFGFDYLEIARANTPAIHMHLGALTSTTDRSFQTLF